MYKRPVHLLLLDIRDAIERIELFTKDKEKVEFIEDIRTNNAVIRNLEIIGEAAN